MLSATPERARQWKGGRKRNPRQGGETRIWEGNVREGRDCRTRVKGKGRGKGEGGKRNNERSGGKGGKESLEAERNVRGMRRK